jgi:hypothetical protein
VKVATEIKKPPVRNTVLLEASLSKPSSMRFHSQLRNVEVVLKVYGMTELHGD